MTAPRVSVVMATYNHAAYVAQAIESVLQQTFVDLQFLIADDGSRDETPAVVRGYSDPRINFAAHARNRGAAVVTNELIARARGDFVAILNSDDFWPLDKLEHQVAFLDSNPADAATFGQARFVDAQGEPLADVPHSFFRGNRSSGRWLRRFFEFGNCLCHPTLLIRRQCYDEVGVYDNRLRQLPDFDMWVRLVKRHQIHVSERQLVNFRMLPGENASAPSPANLVRHFAEHYLIAERFFDGVDPALLRDGFADHFVFPDPPSEVHDDIETALLYFRPRSFLSPAYRVVGLRRLESLLGREPHRAVLLTDYGIDDLAFQRLAGQVDAFAAAFDAGASGTALAEYLPVSGRGDADSSIAPDAEPARAGSVDSRTAGRLDHDSPDPGRSQRFLPGVPHLEELVPDLVLRELTVPDDDDATLFCPSPVVVGGRVLVYPGADEPRGESQHYGHLLTVDQDYAVRESLPLRDETGVAARFRDVRPFVIAGRLHASVLVVDPVGEERTEAGFVEIRNGAFRRLRRLGPRAGYYRAGWAPIPEEEVLRVLAWWEPTETLRFDARRGVFVQESVRFAPAQVGAFRACSQGVRMAEGYLLLANEFPQLDAEGARALSRLVLLDHAFRVTRVSPPFFVGSPGADAATGLARIGDHLVAGFGGNEAAGVLAIFDASRAMGLLDPLVATVAEPA
jgi:glycosyltransferase involved in cell wall biosynthesis